MDTTELAGEQAGLEGYLRQFVTPRRQAMIERVLAQRTRYVTVVLENLSKAHNASAVLRSCDSFGVQDVHVIDSREQFEVMPATSIGAHRWLTRHDYVGAAAEARRQCLTALRRGGYRIAAATLRDGAIPIDALSLDAPVALCFGTERFGLSEALHEAADVWVTVPQVGFAESLNISVAAAVCLYELTQRLRQSSVDWVLPSAERNALRVTWLKQTLRNADEIERRYWEEQTAA